MAFSSKVDGGGGGSASPHYELESKLVDAAINAYMRDAMDDGVWDYKSGSIEDGEWITGLDNGSDSVYYRVSYPGGEWGYSTSYASGIDEYSGEERSTNWAAAPAPLFDAAGAWSDIRDQFSDGLSKWGSMPEASAFEGDMTQLGRVAGELAAGGATVSGEGSDITIDIGNKVLDSYLTTLEDELDSLEGVYVENLRKFVNERLRDVIAGYHALSCVAGALVAGESDMWERTDKEYPKVLQAGIDNFTAYAEHGSDAGDAGRVLEIVGALAGAASLFATGPAAPAALGAVRTVTGVIGTFLPATPEKKEANVWGDSYTEINEKFWEALDNLEKSVDDTESAFRECANRARDLVSSEPRAFDMRRQMEFLKSTGKGLYGPGDTEIKVNEDLKDCAPHFELVGDHLREMAKTLESVGNEGTWTREDIGIGDVGHYWYYQWLIDDLIELLLDSAKEMHLYAEKCLLVYHDFQATDGQIERELNRQAKDVETEVEYQVG